MLLAISKKRHDHVMRDISNIEKDIPNFGEMFFPIDMPDSYGRPQKTYNMNRDGFSILAMGFTGKEALSWKLKYIDAFNRMEQLWNSPEQVMARALKLADKQIANLQLQLEEQRPMVEFANQVSDTQNLTSIGETSKLLKKQGINIGRNKLFKFLRDCKILMNDNIPYQQYIDADYFRVKERVINTPFTSRTESTTFVTGKGQLYIFKLLKKKAS